MVKLSSKHKKTLTKVFEVPTLASIEWRNIEAMFKALGASLDEGNGSRVHVLLNDAVATFHRTSSRKRNR